MTEAYQQGARAPSFATSAAARLALKRAALSVGAAIVGAYGLGAVVTYSPEDPSLNTATDSATTNLFGGPGALVADMIVQTLGAAAPLAMAALMAAGAVRIWRRQLVARIDRRRIGACLIGIFLLAGAASTIPTPEGWPLATGFGGLFGDWTSGLIAALASMPGLPFPHVITGILCAIVGLLAVGWSFQVRAADVKTAAQVAHRAAIGGAAATQRAIGYVSEKTRRVEGEDAPPTEERRAPRVAERPRPAPR
ncbi:MAG: DNA translocase FtsK 4TM domain-containing protein, partial [Phycisphaerales bacterium]|nr:DNA translocase FtsK 4TM domain-containing protein [Hyphomonadaceae bacterium]